MPLDERLGADRLLGGDVVLDDGAQYGELAVLEHAHLPGTLASRVPSVWPAGYFGHLARAGQPVRPRITASASSRPRLVSTTRPASSAAGSGQPVGRRRRGRRQPGLIELGRRAAGRRVSSMIRSVLRCPGVRISRACAGVDPAARRAAYPAGCLTFHQRVPPTWLCAPGPIPHQSPAGPVAAGCARRPRRSLGRPVGDLVPAQPGGAEALVGEQVPVGHRRRRPASGSSPRRTRRGQRRCRPRRSASTPRCGRARGPGPPRPTSPSPRATPPACRR